MARLFEVRYTDHDETLRLVAEAMAALETETVVIQSGGPVSVSISRFERETWRRRDLFLGWRGSVFPAGEAAERLVLEFESQCRASRYAPAGGATGGRGRGLRGGN